MVAVDNEFETELVASWTALGWDETSWDSGDPSLFPESEDSFWDCLDSAEQAAAAYLCYDENGWNAVRLELQRSLKTQFLFHFPGRWHQRVWGHRSWS